ncbi:LysR family transcriptional regulator [Castellaniella sp.]|uniref:LysR family transcriptional regulator n=1 Tax=Castellaniella sp. TaxID=1955812 RepID=UPI002AFE71BF|nr:LysR family transcriptional regulator [Castellaniella sp.]
MKGLPDLQAWALFAKVAETGSFARAAAACQVSQATVSKAISRLEARMKTTLIHRTSRRLTLTDSGRSALDRATRILEEGEAIEAEVTEHSQALRGRVRVSAPMSFGLARLAPLLPGFMTLHPEVQLDVQFNDAQVDLLADHFDLALRIARLADSSLLARRLCGVRVMLVGAPAYLDAHGRPRHPRDLQAHQALHYSYARHGVTWHFRHPRLGEFSQFMPTRLQVNNADALMPALRAGLGLALQPEFLVWPDLQSGALETVLAPWAVEPLALHAVTPPGRNRPARVQAFIDYVAAALQEEPWAQAAARSA